MSDKVVLTVPNVPALPAATSADKPSPESLDERQDYVRRPLSSISTLDDKYATLSVQTASGPLQIKNTSMSEGTHTYNANLMVQSIQVQRAEKSQLAQTFDKDRMYFFGQTLPTLNVSAITMDDKTFQWLQEFNENYTLYYGGSISAEQGAKVHFEVDGVIYTGYMLNMSFSKEAQQRHTAQLSFNMNIVDTRYVRNLTSTAVRTDVGADTTETISAALQTPRTAASTAVSLSAQSTSVASSVEAPRSTSLSLRDAYPSEYFLPRTSPTVASASSENTPLEPDSTVSVAGVESTPTQEASVTRTIAPFLNSTKPAVELAKVPNGVQGVPFVSPEALDVADTLANINATVNSLTNANMLRGSFANRL